MSQTIEFDKKTASGTNLHQYRLVSEIGQGGMSIVYLGRDERLARDVAIKVLHPFLANKKDCRERLVREARIVARLQHPNIVQVYDYSGEKDEGDPLFLVTEYVPGITLRQFGDAHPLFEAPEIGAMIVHQVAVALVHAHEHGVVHRDLKPENVMVRGDGVLKLVDFGIAHVGNQESLTMTGTLLGSPAHIAPEIIEGKNADERSDVFSLATVLYWLCTATLPFQGKNPHSLLQAITQGRFLPPQEVNPRISDEISQIITRGMQTEPGKRFQTLKEMADAIENGLKKFGIEFSSEILEDLLKEPAKSIPLFKQNLRMLFLGHAEALFHQKQTALGLSLLSRLLADDPEDAQAIALMNGNNTQKYPGIFKKIFVTGLAGALLFLGLFLFDPTEKSVVSLTPTTRVPTLADLSPSATENLETDSNIERDKTATKKTDPLESKNNASKAKAKPLVISAAPFADIFVDGKKVAENQSSITLSLPVGEHVIAFQHKYAQSEIRRVTVTSESDLAPIHVELFKPKPATLVVDSDLDADVVINGIFRGSSVRTKHKPIEISLPPKTHEASFEIIVTKEGYRPYVAKHLFIAGQNTNIRIHLAPDSNAQRNS